MTAAAAAMVATLNTRVPKTSRIITACGGKPPRRGGLLGSLIGGKSLASKAHDWKDNNLLLPLDDALIIVSLFPAPIPWSQLEGPCATAWWWPAAAQRMQKHRNFFLVVLKGGAIEPVERRLTLTRAVSAILSETDAVGVYWAEGALVHEPSEFIRCSEGASPQNIPGTLWIDVRVEENENGSRRCFTTGMAPLGFREIEVRTSFLPSETLMVFIGDTACYIVNGRHHIGEGVTMGPSGEEQYKVRHGPSMFDRAPVMELVMA